MQQASSAQPLQSCAPHQAELGRAGLVGERASFELNDDDLDVLKGRLRISPSGTSLPTTQEEEETQYDAYTRWKAEYPNVLESGERFLGLLEGKRVVVFLDYDGTLTPIVSKPEMAIMSEDMRATVRSVAEVFPTAIISGRGREKVEAFVQLQELFYAGSHGMDIAGPRHITEEPVGLKCEPAAQFRPLIDLIHDELQERLKNIDGAFVEHNTLCVSAHFRNCAVENWQQVVAAVDATIAGRPELRMTRGRKVLEIRPQVDWDKGHALVHLLDVLGLRSQEDVLSLYIGDDRTDEDAFKVLREQNLGLGILVSTKSKETTAFYTVNDPNQVQQFLVQLVEYGRSSRSGWHTHKTCMGWVLSCQAEARAERTGADAPG